MISNDDIEAMDDDEVMSQAEQRADHHYDLWRSGFVKRWHMFPDRRLRDSGDLTAAHQWRVAVLVFRLAPEMGYNDAFKLVLQAMLHDADELYTGDAPYTFKQENPEIAAALAKAGRKWLLDRNVPMPPSVDPLVKFCDLLDHVLYAATQCPDILQEEKWTEAILHVSEWAESLGIADEVAHLITNAVRGVRF